MKSFLFFLLYPFVLILTVAFLAVPLHAETSIAKNGKDGSQKIHRIEVKMGETEDSLPSTGAGLPAVATPFLSSHSDPFAEMRALQTRIQKLFGESISQSFGGPNAQDLLSSRFFEPPVNIEDHGDYLYITMDLPGLKKEDIDIALNGQVLTVSGRREERSEEKKEEKGKKMYREERFTGGFQKILRLPSPVKEDTIKARYDQGVLMITAFKLNIPAENTKHIQVE